MASKKHAPIQSVGLKMMEGLTVPEIRQLPKPTAEIKVYADRALKEEAGNAADKEGLSLSEWIVRRIAEAVGKPELGVVPRKPLGRPRKQAAASA